MVVFDIDPTAAAATRNQLFSRLAREDVWVAEPHTSSFPGLGRLHKEGRGYSGLQWYLPINGTRGSKATITTLMTQGPKAPFTDSGT